RSKRKPPGGWRGTFTSTAASHSVSVVQYAQVMSLVAEGDVRQAEDVDRNLVGHAPARPRGVGDSTEHCDRRTPRRFVVIGEIANRAAIEVTGVAVRVLVEAGQRFAFAARDRQCPVAEDSLGIGEMADDSLHAPLAGRVSKSSFLLADAAQDGSGLLCLIGNRFLNVVLRNEIEIALIDG